MNIIFILITCLKDFYLFFFHFFGRYFWIILASFFWKKIMQKLFKWKSIINQPTNQRIKFLSIKYVIRFLVHSNSSANTKISINQSACDYWKKWEKNRSLLDKMMIFFICIMNSIWFDIEFQIRFCFLKFDLGENEMNIFAIWIQWIFIIITPES